MINKRKIGKTNLEVTEISMGTAPIAGWPSPISSNDAYDTFSKAWELGIRYFDTAPLYGSGLAEQRLGMFLKSKERSEFTISTKVGRLVIDGKSDIKDFFKSQDPNKDVKFDFSYDGVMKSIEESLKRLQLDSIDIIFLHDPDTKPEHIEIAKKGAIKAMIKLRDQKVVKAIGAGMNQNEMLVDLANLNCFDCFLLAGRYTLLDQTSLSKLIPLCKNKNISLLVGGVFNSGILIDPSPNSYFDYIKLDINWKKNALISPIRKIRAYESSKYWLEKAYKLKAVSEKFNITLKKASIHFPLMNDIVASTILGMNSNQQVMENINDYKQAVPNEFWEYIKYSNLIE